MSGMGHPNEPEPDTPKPPPIDTPPGEENGELAPPPPPVEALHPLRRVGLIH
ncbi:MAG: hypothetical protein QM759_07065 [Terricaulis sp.]